MSEKISSLLEHDRGPPIEDDTQMQKEKHDNDATVTEKVDPPSPQPDDIPSATIDNTPMQKENEATNKSDQGKSPLLQPSPLKSGGDHNLNTPKRKERDYAQKTPVPHMIEKIPEEEAPSATPDSSRPVSRVENTMSSRMQSGVKEKPSSRAPSALKEDQPGKEQRISPARKELETVPIHGANAHHIRRINDTVSRKEVEAQNTARINLTRSDKSRKEIEAEPSSTTISTNDERKRKSIMAKPLGAYGSGDNISVSSSSSFDSEIEDRKKEKQMEEQKKKHEVETSCCGRITSKYNEISRGEVDESDETLMGIINLFGEKGKLGTLIWLSIVMSMTWITVIGLASAALQPTTGHLLILPIVKLLEMLTFLIFFLIMTRALRNYRKVFSFQCVCCHQCHFYLLRGFKFILTYQLIIIMNVAAGIALCVIVYQSKHDDRELLTTTCLVAGLDIFPWLLLIKIGGGAAVEDETEAIERQLRSPQESRQRTQLQKEPTTVKTPNKKRF